MCRYEVTYFECCRHHALVSTICLRKTAQPFPHSIACHVVERDLYVPGACGKCRKADTSRHQRHNAKLQQQQQSGIRPKAPARPHQPLEVQPRRDGTKKPRRGPWDHRHLPGLPEATERWSGLLDKPLPNLPVECYPAPVRTLYSGSRIPGPNFLSEEARVSHQQHAATALRPPPKYYPRTESSLHLKSKDRAHGLNDAFEAADARQPAIRGKVYPASATCQLQKDERGRKARQRQKEAERRQERVETWRTKTAWECRPVYAKEQELFLTPEAEELGQKGYAVNSFAIRAAARSNSISAEEDAAAIPECLQSGKMSRRDSLSALSAVMDPTEPGLNPVNTADITTTTIRAKRFSELSAEFNATASSQEDDHPTSTSSTSQEKKLSELSAMSSASSVAEHREDALSVLEGRYSMQEFAYMQNSFLPLEDEPVPEKRAVTIAPQLPNVKRHSPLRFGGTILEGLGYFADF